MVQPAGAAAAVTAGATDAAAADEDAPPPPPQSTAAATLADKAPSAAAATNGVVDAPTGPPDPPSIQGRARALLRALLKTLHAQWFLVALLLSVAFAAAAPRLGATGGWLRAESSVRVPAIVLIFLISGSGLKTAVLARAAANLPAHALVQGVSLGLQPLVGWAVGGALRRSGVLPRPLADGVVVMACMPTTISTNVVYTDIAGGNESIALVNAVLGNLIGIFVSPAWITALVPVTAAAAAPPSSSNDSAGGGPLSALPPPLIPAAAAAARPATPSPSCPSSSVPYASVLGELGYLVLAPLVLGQLLQFFCPRAVAWVRSKANLSHVSSFCIVLIVWVSFCNTFAAARAGKGTPATAADAAAAFFLCAALLAVFAAMAVGASRLPVPAWGGGGGAAEAAEAAAAEGGAGGTREQADGKAAAAATTGAPAAAAAAAAAAAEEGRADADADADATPLPPALPAAASPPRAPAPTPVPCACPWRPLPRADAVAVIVCGATKTLALGAPLISVIYGRSDDAGLVALPLVVYHALQCVVGAPLLGPLGRWRRAEARWWLPPGARRRRARGGGGRGAAAGGSDGGEGAAPR